MPACERRFSPDAPSTRRARLRAVAAALAVSASLGVSAARAGDTPAPPAVAFGRPARGSSTGLDGAITLTATAVLAVLGVAVLAASRLRPARGDGMLRVVGRAQLTGRHAVYLLRAGDRTLILGVGAQGPPALLGELGPPGEPAPPAAAAGDRAGGNA